MSHSQSAKRAIAKLPEPRRFVEKLIKKLFCVTFIIILAASASHFLPESAENVSLSAPTTTSKKGIKEESLATYIELLYAQTNFICITSSASELLFLQTNE